MSAGWRALQARVRAVAFTRDPVPDITFHLATGEVVRGDVSGVEREEVPQWVPYHVTAALIRREARLSARVLPEASRDPLDDGYTPPWAEVLR